MGAEIITKAEIKKILPQKEPFLFVDGVLELELGKRILAFRAFRKDEFFFEGHFPSNPIVPGVLLVEALAQTAGILAYKTTGTTCKDKGAVLLKVENFSFRKPVRPEQNVLLAVNVKHVRGDAWKCEGTARVEDKVCASGIIIATFIGQEKVNKD